MPCAGGYRKDIEDSKARYQRDKQYRASAECKHWNWLVDQVYGTAAGFPGLSHPNQIYFASQLVLKEVYNGGFDQYFGNSSGDYFQFAVEGLSAMEATESLRLLTLAKQLVQGGESQGKELEALSQGFCTAPDKLEDRLQQFAQRHELYRNFQD